MERVKCLGLVTTVVSSLTSPFSFPTFLRLVITVILLRKETPYTLLLVSVQVLVSLTSPGMYIFAIVLFYFTPTVVKYDVQSVVNTAVLQLLISTAGIERNQHFCTNLVLNWSAALVGYYVCYLERTKMTVEVVIGDTEKELESLHSVVSVTSERVKRSKTDLRKVDLHTFSSISSKLKLLAPQTPPLSRKLSMCFSDYVALATPQNTDSAKLSIASEDGKSSTHSNDLSTDEVDTLKAALLTKQYILFGAKRQKTTPIQSDFLQMLTQKSRVSLRNTGTAFKGRTRARLRSMMEENSDLTELFEHLGEWNFDIFNLLTYTNFPLQEVGYYIFTALNFPHRFSLQRDSLLQFLNRVESGYRSDNYYHNSLHAADVTNSVYFLLYSGMHRCGNFLELEIFTLVTAALAHDIGHPGFNNAFLVQSQDQLAKVYNDHSVLENMHAATLFSILKTKQSDITQALVREDYLVFRKLSIALILATDLQRHFDKQAEFKSALESGTSLEDVEFRQMTLEICLKCADIGHGAKELRLHKHWSSLITKEFFRQGDTEKKLGLPISPICNRDTVVISKSQIGFIEVFVKPMFDMWMELVRRTLGEGETTPVTLECPLLRIKENLEFWTEEFQAFQSGKAKFVLDDNPPYQVMKLLNKWP